MAKGTRGSHPVAFPISTAMITAGPVERSQEVPRKHPFDIAALQSPIPSFLRHSRAALRPPDVCRKGVGVVDQEV